MITFGGVPAVAFPNVAISLQQVIQKQDLDAGKSEGVENFAFGILGSAEFRTGDHRFGSSWRALVKRIADERAVYERCVKSAADCPPKVREWRELLQSLQGLPTELQLARLNKAINRMAVYTDDGEVFGKQDYWATPLEFLKGRGDCEDYAAIKFWSLLELGFSNEQLRFAVVRDERRGLMHAVVTVAMGEQTFVLDSLFDHPVEQRYVLKYAPVFSANLGEHWAHIVTRKIRTSYLDSLEKREKARLAGAKLRGDSGVLASQARGFAHPKVSAPVKFVDWT